MMAYSATCIGSKDHGARIRFYDSEGGEIGESPLLPERVLEMLVAQIDLALGLMGGN